MASGIQVLSPTSPELAAPTEPRWYLAYGSNLSATGFVVKRNITPLDTKVVIVDGLTLTFDNPGVPYIEPRFANCRLVEPAAEQWSPENPWMGDRGSLMGVAYLLSPADFLTILRSEGGGTSYQPLIAPAAPLAADGARTQQVINAYTLLTPTTRRGTGYASLRYMNLLRNGAREQHMPEPYIAYLDSIPSYRITSFRQKIGRLVHIVVWMPGLLVFFRIVARLSSKTGRAPKPILWTRRALFGTMWGLYDLLGKWVFGDGEASS
ncbi:hypothetical protein J3R30DRAFT_3450208 [Lentinula aciculospora]|uniref:gamma-glutamylcyclotransferase n=1 Tax=Lentinula aciculospora TaxID=153920 RepID=A0A9W9DRZ2_9AGAR|nr:hypothetical protein J3R30DRAFT_3685896 [Lentinula aciculospora]KAJ4483632.1 hypothetical protein J3R30DRAFT_3450208 [Lentinula aciculospora]